MTDFDEMGLNLALVKGLQRMGYSRPFPIQEQTVPPLLGGHDVIGQARTGSGKTAAFALPLLQKVDPALHAVQGLVLAPTRELAVQITEEMKRIGAFTQVRVVTIYGGQSANLQHAAIRHGAHVVVGTPGRVIDLLDRGWLEFSGVTFVVLDEADTMLDMGFIEDVELILSATPARRQTCLFSATMPRRIVELAGRFMSNPEKILVDSGEPEVETLEQAYAVLNREEKLQFLVSLLQHETPSSAIVFCRTKHGAHRLARDLRGFGFEAVPLHGDLSQRQRDDHMGAFRNGRADVLVATDVASRGIDVSQVECVVNYDVPSDPLLYFHRVGRTARAGKAGKAYTFVSRDEFGDFGRILRMSKTGIRPLRESDGHHDFREEGRSWRRQGRESRTGGRGWRGRSAGHRWRH